MIRKQVKYFGPLFFGLVSFLFYMVIYRPPVGSEDFITALMVFCAALAWSAVLTLTKEKKQWVLYLYLLIAVILPFIMALFLNEFNILWHMVALGLMVLAVVGLRLFVPGYLKYKKEE
jgi:predicted membrane protein